MRFSIHSVHFLAWFFLALLLNQCTHPPKDRSGGSEIAPPSSNEFGMELAGCRSLEAAKIPFYNQATGVFVTKAMKDCSNETRAGIVHGSGWTAMALPCSNGEGKFDHKGSIIKPKMVSFNFGSHCRTLDLKNNLPIKNTLLESSGLSENEPMLAITPMMVQYWQVMGTKDKGMGSKVELRSYASLHSFEQMKKGAPMTLVLYGRESSWSKKKQMYKYEIEVSHGGSHKFIPKVISGTVMSPEDKSKLHEECQSLIPARPCHMLK